MRPPNKDERHVRDLYRQARDRAEETAAVAAERMAYLDLYRS